MPPASSNLGRTLDEVVSRKTPRRILPSSVKAGRRAAVLVVGKRGRYVRYRIPIGGKVNDIAIMPTIRSAIMHAIGGKIQIKKTDLREKVRRRKVSVLVTVVIDGSSSMLEGGRPGAIRAILDELLMDAYQKRDRMAIIHCGGGQASLLLSFAGNVESGRAALEKAPWGGTDSVPAGLEMAGEIMAQKLRTERNAIPAVVILCDGDLSGPSAERVTTLLEELSERAAVLCIDFGADTGEPLMMELADTVDAGYYQSEKTLPLSDVPDLGEVHDALAAVSLMVVNPRCGPVLLGGFGDRTLRTVCDLIREKSWDIEVMDDCDAGCRPPAGARLCPSCRARKTAKTLKTRQGHFPVVLHTGAVGDGSLGARVYVHNIVEGGLLPVARRGLLMLSLSEIAPQKARELAEMFASGLVRPLGARPGFSISSGNNIALAVPDTRVLPGPLNSRFGLKVLRKIRPGKLVATLRLKKDAALWPAHARRNLLSNMADILDHLHDASDRIGLTTVSEQGIDFISTATNLLAPKDPGAALALMEAGRAFAAIRGIDSAGPEEIVPVLWLVLGDRAPPPNLRDDLNSELFITIAPAVHQALAGGGAILLRNPPQGFTGLFEKLLPMIAPPRQYVANCNCGCSPDRTGGLCPECAIRSGAGALEPERARARMEVLSLSGKTPSLKGNVHIRHVVLPGTLARANRGALVIRDAEQLDYGSARIIAEALVSGHSPISGSPENTPFSAAVFAFATKGAPPPALSRCFGMEIDLGALADGAVIARAALRHWRALRKLPNAISGKEPGDIRPLAPEQLLDLIARLAPRGPGEELAGSLELLRLARSVAAARGSERIEEADAALASELLSGRWKHDQRTVGIA